MMEREYLVGGLIVIFVLVVLFVGFFTLFPEVKDRISKFSTDFLKLGFAMSDEEIRATVKLAVDSFDKCSASADAVCKCDVELDIIPGDNHIIVDNDGGESKFILVNENQQVDATWSLAGRKVGVPAAAFDGSAWSVYCNFDSLVLTYDSGWHYRAAKVGSENKELVSSDQVSKYVVIKLGDGNFCFVDEPLLGFEIDVGSKGAKPEEKFVKIKELPEVDGTFGDYYSVEDFFNLLDECKIAE